MEIIPSSANVHKHEYHTYHMMKFTLLRKYTFMIIKCVCVRQQFKITKLLLNKHFTNFYRKYNKIFTENSFERANSLQCLPIRIGWIDIKGIKFRPAHCPRLSFWKVASLKEVYYVYKPHNGCLMNAESEFVRLYYELLDFAGR